MPDPAKVIAEALAEKLHWLADPERAQELAEAVLAALAAAGFPVGADALREAERAGYCRGRDNERAVREAAQPAAPIPWGRVRELLLGDEAVEAAVSAATSVSRERYPQWKVDLFRTGISERQQSPSGHISGRAVRAPGA